MKPPAPDPVRVGERKDARAHEHESIEAIDLSRRPLARLPGQGFAPVAACARGPWAAARMVVLSDGQQDPFSMCGVTYECSVPTQKSHSSGVGVGQGCGSLYLWRDPRDS